MFEEVAGDIAFALYGMELEEKSKQAEERLQQAYNELEVRVKERTAEIERTTRELHAEAKERSRVSKQLRKSLKEKETLLQEVHHRVKNNLQVISSLLDLSSLRVHDQQATNMLTDARTRIYTMSLIHSQLYTSERLDKVEMGRHVRELVNYLSEVYEKQKGITTVIEIPDIYLPVTQAIPCATVLSELISNAIKHAFRGKPEGMVEISMNKSDESIIIVRVKDDGIGIPGEVDIDKTNSLGLKLVRNMVRKQLGGKIRLVRNGGSEFIVEFKIQG